MTQQRAAHQEREVSIDCPATCDTDVVTATISSLMASADGGDAGAAETLFSTLYEGT